MMTDEEIADAFLGILNKVGVRVTIHPIMFKEDLGKAIRELVCHLAWWAPVDVATSGLPDGFISESLEGTAIDIELGETAIDIEKPK